ncbi:MAG TPA: hypothetical protein VGK20_03320 [Candidatus Binatia bacterium]|jgi:hypothetical protein
MTIRRSFFGAALCVLLAPAVPAHALISFGPPKPLNSTAATDADATTMDDDVDSFVSIANDGSSHWVAAWSSDNSLGNTIGGDSDILVETSSDDGKSWSAAFAAMAAAATDGSAPDTTPKAAYGNGVFVIAFSSANNLGDNAGSDTDILFTRSTNNGTSWAAPGRVNSGGQGDGNFDLDVQPSIATDGAGKWLVVWKHVALTAPTGDQVFYSYSTNDAVNWSPQQPLGILQTTNQGNDQGTAVVWNGSAFVVAWGSAQDLGSNGNDGDILVSTVSVPAFTASAPALLNDSGTTDGPNASDKFPALSAMGSTIVAAWESNANVGGSGTDVDILFSRSTNGGSIWSAAAPLPPNATTDAGDDNNVALANDGTTMLAVWDTSDPLDKASKKDRDIYVSRSDDGGQTWSPRATLATNAAKDKGADIRASISANIGNGTWDVAWESTDSLGKSIGTDSDILYVHSSKDCPAVPVAASSCFQSIQPGASSMLIKEAGAKDSFSWKFLRSADLDKAMDLGNPITTNDYVMCVYDESAGVPTLISEIDMEAGGNCFLAPCWTDIGDGYTYKHKFGIATSASFVAGTGGTGKAYVKGKGGFQAPLLPLNKDTQVLARLHKLGLGSKCFATDFSNASTNTATQFKANAD